jgi:hypothetical protein
LRLKKLRSGRASIGKEILIPRMPSKRTKANILTLSMWLWNQLYLRVYEFFVFDSDGEHHVDIAIGTEKS